MTDYLEDKIRLLGDKRINLDLDISQSADLEELYKIYLNDKYSDELDVIIDYYNSKNLCIHYKNIMVVKQIEIIYELDVDYDEIDIDIDANRLDVIFNKIYKFNIIEAEYLCKKVSFEMTGYYMSSGIYTIINNVKHLMPNVTCGSLNNIISDYIDCYNSSDRSQIASLGRYMIYDKNGIVIKRNRLN